MPISQVSVMARMSNAYITLTSRSFRLISVIRLCRDPPGNFSTGPQRIRLCELGFKDIPNRSFHIIQNSSQMKEQPWVILSLTHLLFYRK